MSKTPGEGRNISWSANEPSKLRLTVPWMLTHETSSQFLWLGSLRVESKNSKSWWQPLSHPRDPLLSLGDDRHTPQKPETAPGFPPGRVTISLAIISCEEEAISMSQMTDVGSHGQLPCEEWQGCRLQVRGVVSWSAPVIKAAEWWQETARDPKTVSVGWAKDSSPARGQCRASWASMRLLSSAQLNCSQSLSAPHVTQSQTSDFRATTWNGRRVLESQDLTH